MQASTAAAGTLIVSNDMVIEHSFTISLPGGLFEDLSLAIDSISYDRSITTDQPAGTRLISGYPSAGATVTLSGLYDQTNEASTAARLFNPYDSLSPLYRRDALNAPCAIQAGVYNGTSATPELFTQLIGMVDDYTIDEIAGTVTLTIIDNRQKLRSAPTIVPTANPYPIATANGGAFPLSGNSYPLLTSTWVLDYLLRNNNIHTCPPPRTGCVAFLSMQGGLTPQVWSENGYPPTLGSAVLPYEPSVFATGYYSQQIPQTFQALFSVYPTPTIASTTANSAGFYAEWTMLVTAETYQDPSNVGGAPQTPYFYVSMDNTSGFENVNYSLFAEVLQPFSFAKTYGGTLNLLGPDEVNTPFACSAGWHRFGMQVLAPTLSTFEILLYVDGVLTVTYSGTTPAAPTTTKLADTVLIEGTMCDAIQITNELAAVPLVPAAFVPSAYLDASLNPLTATLDISGADPWATIQALAEAELGVAGFDELGVFRFKNRTTLLAGTSVRQITSASSLKTLTAEMSLASFTDHVIVPVNQLVAQPGVIWSAGTDIIPYMPANSVTYGTPISTQDPVIASGLIVANIPTGLLPVGYPAYANSPTPCSGYRACTTQDGTGTAVTNLVMSVEQLSPTFIEVTLQNPNNFEVYLVTPSGAGFATAEIGVPWIIVGGSIIETPAAAVATPTSGTPTVVGSISSSATNAPPADAQWPTGNAPANVRGEVVLNVSANPWLQDPPTAQVLAEVLLEDLIYPRPLLTSVQIVADPRLQLGDRVTLVDPDASQMNDDAIIVGISFTDSATDWSQTVDLRAVASPGFWTLDVPGKSEMGSTTWI